MKWRIALAATVLISAGLQPAMAQQRDPFERLEGLSPETLLKGILREDDVSLLFRHLRESIAASARGEEDEPSEAMRRRAEQIQREFAVRGALFASALLSALEQAAKDVVREGMRDPPRRTPPKWPPTD